MKPSDPYSTFNLCDGLVREREARPMLPVLLWKYPDTTAAPLCINTQHRLNIFGVQFLPCSNDSKIVTAAFDRTVQLHTLDRAPLAYPAHRRTAATRGNDRIRPIDCHTVVYSNHSECVKDIVVEEGNAHCFWSAGSDGRVHQFDTRSPEHLQPDAHNMLIKAPTIHSTGVQLEFKALDMNKARPWLMAAACSDQYVRIYDRRKMSVRAPTGSHASTPLLSLAPLHMLLDRSGTNTCHTTCARFSHRGDKVLANYHSDQEMYVR